MNIQNISAPALNSLKLNSPDLPLLDVRTNVEYAQEHIDGALNIPLDQLDVEDYIKRHKLADGAAIYITCRSGKRGSQACQKFIAAGHTNVFNLEGGVLSWISAGLPVNRDSKVISLERQVRIAAGSLVVLGIILGLFVDPIFFGLSAFVGAGLVFSGVTDTCGMAMVLAKMPWNRR